MKGGRWAGLPALLIVALLAVAPLAALAPGAGASSPGTGRDVRFSFTVGEDRSPTLFISTEYVPIAVWEDPVGNLRMSQLVLVGSPKEGLPLSNLPRIPGPPVDGEVEQAVVDASGLLHVVWEDGSGGLWHKAYDSSGNVVVNNHKLSATDAYATAPAMAASPSKEGATAWVSWIEHREGIGTHVRVSSIDSAGNVLDSYLADGYASDLSPTACDVFAGLSGRPHVTALGAGGAYLLRTPEVGEPEIVVLCRQTGSSLPALLDTGEDVAWAVWRSSGSLVGLPLGPDRVGEEVAIVPASMTPSLPRVSDRTTATNGGPLAVLTADGTILAVRADGEGGLLVEHLLTPAATSAPSSPSVAVDERGQTYVAWTDAREGDLDCFYRVSNRMPDVDLEVRGQTVVDGAIALRPGIGMDLPITITSTVDYRTRLTLGTAFASGSPSFTAAILGDGDLELQGLATATVALSVLADEGAESGASTTLVLTATPEGWPDVVTEVRIPLIVPVKHPPFTILGPTTPLTALPGETVTTFISLESWSDQVEVARLEVTCPKGWEVEVPEETRLAPGTTVEVPVKVTAPPATPAGTEVTIEVKGVTDVGVPEIKVFVATIVDSHTGAELVINAQELVVPPGGTATLEARVRNTGNELVSLDLSVSAAREGWSAKCIPSHALLTPGSEAPLLVNVSAPAGAPYCSRCDVAVMATGPGPLDLATVLFRATAGLLVDYDLALLPLSAPVVDGRADLTLELYNHGNAPEGVIVDFLGLPAGWSVSASWTKGSLILNPRETRSGTLTFIAPEGAPAGKVPVAAVLRGSRGPVTTWSDLHVINEFTADILSEVTVHTLTPPGTVAFPITITNVGNSEGNVHLSTEGVPPGWDFSFQTSEGEVTADHTLAAGTSTEALLVVWVPATASGDHPIDLVCRDVTNLALSRETVFVRLRFPDLAVLDLSISPQQPRAGAPVTIRARVLNLGGADAEDVTVVLREGNTVLDRDQLHIVSHRGEAEVVLYLVPKDGRHTLVLEVDPADSIRELDETNNRVLRHVEVSPAPKEPLVSPAVARASVVVVVTLSVLSLLGGTEVGRYALIGLLFLPLYTKLKKDRVLDHYLRGKIHGYIIANPGEHYNAIKDQLDVTNGALSYHLRVLEREGYVRSRMDGMYKRFYPADMKLPRSTRQISSFQEVILTIVKNKEGLSQKEIARRIGASSQVINYHIKILEESGLIKVDRTRRKSRVYATDAPTSAIE